MTKIIGYKGFDKNWKCRDFQYEVGKTYVHDGDAVLCGSGFHFCEYPLDILQYYPPTGQMAVIEADDVSEKKENGDTKRVSKKITIKASISLCDLITASVKYTVDHATDSGAASNSGDSGAASNSGFRGAASNSGVRGAASNSGDSGAASNSGFRGAASNSGFRGAASNSGDSGAASNSGFRGAASNSGDRGAASNSGDSGAASNSGFRGAASNSGDSGAASNSGKFGIAADFNGFYTKVKSCDGGAIVAINRAYDGSIRHIRASKVGDNGIFPDVWYSLNDAGEFVEVK